MKSIGVALLLSVACVIPLRSQGANAAPRLPITPEGQLLLKAAHEGDLNRVKVLLDQGIPVDSPGPERETALFLSAEKHPDVALYLIAKGANVNALVSVNCTPLLNAAFGDDTQAVLALLAAGADPNIGSTWHRFPLMNAAQHGNDQLVTALLAHHADVNANCDEGSAVYWAASNDKMGALKLLAEAGANLHLGYEGNLNPHLNHYPLLGLAAENGDLDMIDFLLAHGVTVNEASADGSTALMAAANSTHPPAVEKLLQLGAPIDAQMKDGNSALHLAAEESDPSIEEIFIAHHAKLNLQDDKGRTPLMDACAYHRLANVKALIDAGADLNITDHAGNTALTYAGSIGETQIVDLLRDKGAYQKDVHLLNSDGPPKEKLSPPDAWALAVGVMYAQRDGLDLRNLGGDRDRLNARQMLRDGWKINDRAGLLRELDSLRDQGHHTLYAEDGKKLAELSDDEFQGVLDKDPAHLNSLQAMRKSYIKWKERTGLAWDLCRSAMLVSNGYAAHYLSEKEAWDNLLPIAQQVQGTFGSWEEMSDNFLDGREIWANQRDPHFEACAHLLLDPAESLSPWNQNPWQTELSSVANK